MTAGKKDNPGETGVKGAIEILKAADATKPGADQRRLAFTKLYKHLSREERTALCSDVATNLKERFDGERRLESVVHLVACAIATERDWDAATILLKVTIDRTTDAEFLRELSLILLEMVDSELTDRHGRIPLAQTILVLLTELGLQLAARVGDLGFDVRETGRVVEYITTNLLARSNINNMAIRIALVHYLTRCPQGSQASMQLNRVISRFGQSLLDDMLKAFFEDKRKANASFFFLVEHLNAFFMSSPALAEMSHNVLKHFMLKHPDEFPPFLASYSEFISKDVVTLSNATRHIALLQRAAVEVNQRDLAASIGRILVRHLAVFRDASHDLMREQTESALAIVTGQGKLSRNPLLEDFLRDARHLIEPAATENQSAKVVSLARRRGREAAIKFAKVGEKPSPLEQMLLLAV